MGILFFRVMLCSPYIFYKIATFRWVHKFSNVNSDFTSVATVRNLEIPYTIFVVSEQVLDAER